MCNDAAAFAEISERSLTFAAKSAMKTVPLIKNKDVHITAPPSKAHTLRALIIGSLADGQSVICNPLVGQDQLNVIECLRHLGVTIERDKNFIAVSGCSGSYAPAEEKLDVGESGVGMNFLTAASCFAIKPVCITGSKRLCQRPLGELVKGLRQLGCKIEYLEKEGFLPLKNFGAGIKGGRAGIKGGETSQYFSALAISAPYADKQVTLECLDQMSERPYFDISLQMLREFGGQADNQDYKLITVSNGKRYGGRRIQIEGDYSSAAFFFLAAAICGTKVTVEGLNPASRQGDKVFVNLLEKMGCSVTVTGEAVSIEGGVLQAIERDMGNIPDLLPPLSVAAGFAKGTSRFTNVSRLTMKESDRIAVMVSELDKMGVTASYDGDSLLVEGAEKIQPAVIDPHNDHRIAMSFAAAGLRCGGQVIENEKCVGKSFPDFWEKFEVFTR